MHGHVSARAQITGAEAYELAGSGLLIWLALDDHISESGKKRLKLAFLVRGKCKLALETADQPTSTNCSVASHRLCPNSTIHSCCISEAPPW